MGRHLFQFEGVFEVMMLFKLLTICMNMATSYGQPGFLSLDCGSSRDNYTDDIGLSWVTDEPYIGTGSKSDRLFKINSSVYDNSNALEYFRYFPEPRNKYCYDLPTDSNISYLIRARFYYNYSESKVLPLPTEFNVFINNTKWFTIDYTDTGEFLETQEGIFYSPGDVIYFCLLPLNGTPFISSLELRRLDPEGIMYTYLGRKSRYLSLQARYNYGASLGAPTVRFPDDPFDRYWEPYSGLNYLEDSVPDYVLSGPDPNTSVDVNNVPTKVMLDALRLNFTTLRLSSPTDNVYIAVYSEDLNATESGGAIDIYNGDREKVYDNRPFNVTSKASMQVFSNLFLGSDYVFLDFSGYGDNYYLNDLPRPLRPLRPPVNVNALEVYAEHTLERESATTDIYDLLVIKDLQRSFNINSWHGDPCWPLPYNELECGLSIFSSSYVVTSITLSNLRSDGWSSLMNASYHNFGLPWTSLMNGSYHNFGLPTMDQLSLTHSEINNDIFQFLIENFTNRGNILNLSYNIINNISPSSSSSWINKFYPRYLDLSHNALNGVLPLFTTPFINVSSFLVQVNISDNKLIGVHPRDLYFSNGTHLQTINFDRNIIQGTLNLTLWYESLQQNMTLPGPLFTFVNNLIMNIIPNIEVLEPIIAKRMVDKDPRFNKTGVLLGGNPYCNDTKSLTHQYLCRYKISDIIHQDKEKNNTLLLAGTIGGVLLFLMCCVLFATSWKLWKKVSALRQIQQALADQKVQPPFYTYNELKLATKDFHKNNKLGNGAFGVVYKGVLPNGSILAVKKLFNSQQLQVLNEFLNEVVLITGIKHRNLVQLKGCCINDQQRILVYEYVENGNLAEALWEKKKSETMILDWQQRFNICVGVARGLLYLHEELQPRIIHRDIKPTNILLDKNLNPKIADFGLARRFLDDQSQAQFTNIAGTRGYFAPEYASERKLTEKADVFSFGILVLEIVTGRKAIDYDMPPERVFLKDWVQKLHKDGMLLEVLQPNLPQNYVEDEVIRVINIALICVQMDSERRATMSQVVTMLLGSMDVTVFLDMSNPNFNILFPTNESHNVTNISTFHKCNAIVEECDESPLLQVDLESSLPSHSNTTTYGIATVELSDMSLSER